MNRSRRSLLWTLIAAQALQADRAGAQRPSLRRVGVLAPSTRAKEEVTLEPFFTEMRRLGWIEGENIAFDRLYGDDQHQQLPRLAVELVGRAPELIYAPPLPAAVAARKATSSIPIVFATGTDPVGAGIVRSLRRPGGNTTGIISVVDSLAPKLLELLHEILPDIRRIGLLGDPADPRWRGDQAALRPIAQASGLAILSAALSEPAQLEAAVDALVRQNAQAIVTNSSITFNLRDRLIELANRHRLPVAGHRVEIAEAGALLTYGAPLHEQIRRSAHLVDKVLRGEKPGNIPVEQPTHFELVVNQHAARTLGVVIPAAVTVRADRVID